jgi:hypothetical protein
MSFATIELILWGCFALLIWGLRDSIRQVESEIAEQDALMQAHRLPRQPRFSAPQNLIEPIGSYMDSQIYHYAVIEGKHYCFDHVCPDGMRERIGINARCVAPGLVYVECALPSS